MEKVSFEISFRVVYVMELYYIDSLSNNLVTTRAYDTGATHLNMFYFLNHDVCINPNGWGGSDSLPKYFFFVACFGFSSVPNITGVFAARILLEIFSTTWQKIFSETFLRSAEEA